LKLIALGRFGAAQGVRGEIRVKSYTADPLSLAAYGPLTDATGAKRWGVQALRHLRDDMIVARVEGVTTREAAEALTGVELYAPRSQLPPPGPDEFYHSDLIGLEAVTAAGERLGRVSAVLNHGAGDILEIDGGLLLPFTKAVVPEIDFAGGRVVVAPPEEIEGEAVE